MRTFRRLLIADFKQFYRDRTALFFTIAFPVLFMVIFGLVFSGNTDVNYKIGLVNRDSSPLGEGISQALHQVPIFEIAEGNELEGKLEELEDGDVRAVIVIPEGIESSIGKGEPVDITVYYDPSQTTSTQIIRSVMMELIDEMDRQLTNQPALLGLSEESISSHDLRNIDYLVPGILAMSMMMLGLFGSLTLVERREKKVLKRFGATPVSRSTVVYSQVAYRLVLAVMQTGIIVAIAYFAFDVRMLGNWLVLLGMVLLGTLVFISLGYLAVSRARTTEGAMPIIQILQFPMLFLSGIFFPVEFFPSFMRPVVDAIPVTYLADGLRQVMVNATPLHSLTIDAAVLGGWLVVCLVLSIRLFKWE